MVNGRQLTVYHTAGVRRELHDQSIAVCNLKPRWLTKAFLCAVHEIEHDDVVSDGIFAYKFPDKHSQDCTKQALITFEEDKEAYRVEVIAASHRLKQQLMSCTHSTSLV